MSKLFIGKGANATRVVVSLCDYSGQWPAAYIEDGYTVVLFDLKHGDDCTKVAETLDDVSDAIANAAYETGTHRNEFRVVGVLAAPPCTDFSVSGAQYWPKKDADGTTQKAIDVVRACLSIIRKLNPVWYAIENPVGRLPKCVPEIGKPLVYLNPCDVAGYGLTEAEREAARYTKKTGLWGDFNVPTKAPLEPIRACAQGSWIQKLGGKSERTKELRSMTPVALSRAFYAFNR